MENMKDSINKILVEVNKEIEPYLNDSNLISKEMLNSFDIMNLIMRLEEKFDIEINSEDVLSENFESVEAISALVEKCQKLNNLSLHHIGFAVRSIKDSSIYFKAIGAKFFHTSYDEERNLNFRFAYLGGTMIELIEPHDLKLPCVITHMIEKQACTLYHIGLKTEDLEAELIRLKNMKFKQIGKVLINDIYSYKKKSVFLFSKGIGLVELIQECTTNE